MNEMLVAFLALSAGFIVASLVSIWSLRTPRPSSMRTNVDGNEVPVVLGWSVLTGGFAGLLTVVICVGGPDPWLPVRIVGPLIAITFLVGWWDDRKGDERPRGFGGHLGALRGGAITGGMVKLVGGGIAGIVAMATILGGISEWGVLLLGAAAIALSANLINLFDRAPGRASKVFLLASSPLVFISADWRLVAAGVAGAVLATLLLDLAARAMLGDAGANPIGAILGFGLVLASGGSIPVLIGIVAVLLALNLASERWSFSRVIQQTSWLARLDQLGRK